MAVTTTLPTIFKRVVRELWPTRFPLIVPVSSLHANSTATALQVDSATGVNAKYSSGDANGYDGVGVYMTVANTSATAPEGEYGGRVTSGGYAPTTGIFTISGGFSADPNITPTNTPDILFLYGLHPADMLHAINNLQHGLFYPRLLPFAGLVTDGNMETTGVTNWTSIGTPSAKAKVTTTANVLFGTQSLHVTAAAAGDGVRTANIACAEQRPWLLSVALQVAVGTWTVAAYDATAGANISPTATCTATEWTEVRFPFMVPTSCKNVQVRITGSANLDECYINYVALYPQAQGSWLLPSGISDTSYLEEVLYLPQGASPIANYNYVLNEEPFQAWSALCSRRDWHAVNPQRFEVQTPIVRPLFLNFRAAGSTFTGINATISEVTDAPEDVVVAGTVAECFRLLGDEKEHRRWQATYEDLKESLGLRPFLPDQYKPQRRVRVP